MKLPLDTELKLPAPLTCRYFIYSHHRKNKKNKSIWTITREEEVDCFVLAQTNNWKQDFVSWGIIHDGTAIKELGTNPQNEILKLAKFVDSNNNDIWHGYPADYIRNDQDRPNMSVLQAWRTKKYIEKHHVTKIRQGKECSL